MARSAVEAVADEVLNTGQKINRRDRLDRDIGGADLANDVMNEGVLLSGQHQDRDLITGKLLIAAQLIAKFETVHTVHVQIGNDDIGHFKIGRFQKFDRPVAILGFQDIGNADLAQQMPNDRPHAVLIVENKHTQWNPTLGHLNSRINLMPAQGPCQSGSIKSNS